MKTEIVKINNKKVVERAVEILSFGGIVIYPTETCYGIGADATNDDAVQKVLAIKKRLQGKHVSVAFCDIRMVKKYLVVTKNAEKLAKNFMPGPLTLIVESKSKAKNRVGFRIPNNKPVLSIIRKLGKPITTTSANISGKEELYKIRDIIRVFDGKVDIIADAGNLKKTKPSTVYDVTEKKLLRKGPITEKQIRAVLA